MPLYFRLSTLSASKRVLVRLLCLRTCSVPVIISDSVTCVESQVSLRIVFPYVKQFLALLLTTCCVTIKNKKKRQSLSLIYPWSCTVRKELIIKLKHMSHVACNFYMIAALCKLNKDDFESKIIMNRLFHLLNIQKIMITAMGPIFFVKLKYIFQDSYPQNHTEQ